MPLMRCGSLPVLFLLVAAAMLSPTIPARGAESSKQLALVIGNSAYRNVTSLTNPVNDATDIANKLKSLQFEVLLATDADHAKMRSLLNEFRSRLTRDHVALFFYAGHGVTVNNESFLLPVDAPGLIELDERGEQRAEAPIAGFVSMASVLSPLEASRLGIVFLDACRTKAAQPGSGLSLRVVSLGTKRDVPILRGAGSLHVMPSPHSAGVFRAYATQLDNVASDGAGRNSPFTKALLKHIDTKGITIQELMIRVRKSVMQETGNAQVPWEEAALNEPFSFVPPVGGSPASNKLPPNVGIGIGTGL